jgi:predicted regulator of Ras-like GTPase activity (Roadblock/LC7/MglB family)
VNTILTDLTSDPLAISFRRINEEIDNLMAFEGVEAVLLLRIDGLVIESKWPDEITDNLLPLAHWIKKVIAKVSEELQEHTPYVSYDRPPYTVSFFKTGQAGILCGVFDENAPATLLNIELNRTAEVFQKLLEETDV